MTRETSLDAYHDIIENGLLSKLREEVYRVVYKHGPLSAQEAWQIIKEDPRSIIKNRRDGITQRFSELERVGVIEGSIRGICSVSGRVVIKWKVTNKLPIKEKKKKSNNQIISELLSQKESLIKISTWALNKLCKTSSGEFLENVIRAKKIVEDLNDPQDPSNPR